MPFYKSDQELYTVLKAVFEQVKEKETVETFTRSNLVIRMRFSGPDAEILLDGRQPPLEVFFGDRPGRADFEMNMNADDLHDIWMGRRKLKDAFFSGDIQTKGNIFRVSKLTDLFREAERTYPAVLREHGLLDR